MEERDGKLVQVPSEPCVVEVDDLQAVLGLQDVAGMEVAVTQAVRLRILAVVREELPQLFAGL